ncbi:MAG: hypothetical protein KC506_00030 [Nanoarchaeota archaeon]|nr:hypothetical protein [Nanoarchaeota archaeon]
MNKKILISIVIIAALLLATIVFIDSKPATQEISQNNSENNTEENQESIQKNQTNSEETVGKNLPKTHTVEMLDFEFSPQDIIIDKGDTVTWVNKGKGPHYVLTSSGKRILDSRNIKPEESWSYTFEEPGIHKYFSPIYTRMVGTVSVRE